MHSKEIFDQTKPSEGKSLDKNFPRPPWAGKHTPQTFTDFVKERIDRWFPNPNK